MGREPNLLEKGKSPLGNPLTALRFFEAKKKRRGHDGKGEFSSRLIRICCSYGNWSMGRAFGEH